MVGDSNSGKDFEMPAAIKEKWQRMVNIMSNLLRVPTGFIMKVNGPHIQIFTANVADTNPYHAGQNFEIDGLYCEEVMKSDKLLLVPDALKDPEWDDNPEIPAGFIYYLGYPIHWPTGKMFGTICVQDYENNLHATDNKDLLEEFRSVCELDLLMIQQQLNLEGVVAERTLIARKEADQFRLVFENARNPIVWADPETGIILNCNKAAENLLEWSRDEIIGRHQTELHPPEEAEHHAAIFKSQISATSFAEDEGVALTKSGRHVPVQISSSVSQVGERRIIQGIFHNISDRKKAEQLLGESEAKYRTLVEHAPDGIFIVDATTGQFLDSNRRGLEMFGYSREKMLSFTPIDFSPPFAPDGRPVPEVLQERLASLIPGEQVMFEWVHLHADGHEIPCEIRAVLLPSPDRRILRASMVDITERKRAEEALEERLRFEELVAGISTKFIGLSGVEFEQAIHDALTEIGRYFVSDTVRLYRLSLQGDVLKIRNMWRDENLTPPKEMAEILTMKYPNLAAHYSKGESTVFSKYDDSPQWPEMRKILRFFGTEAGVRVPLESDSAGVDVFAMDKIGSEYVWPKDIVEQSKTIGKVILSAMRRREAEVELQDSYAEVRELKDRLEQENIYLQQEIKLEHQHADIIGRSTAIKTVLNKAEQVAKTDSTVLVLGETGTGKELLARAIHNLSNRKARPMVKVNCAAMPSTLIENEFFGREKGAYTGALTRQAGRFEIADRSTIFLDEISELSLDLQAKLLRVLQEGQFERLGNPETIEVDVRVIAATNRDLAEAVQKGTFRDVRDDLYYRLNVFPISIPPLRERREDIPTLVWHFVPELSERMGKRIESVPKKAMEALQSYPWPGNVRELRNVIENAMIVTTGSVLQVEIPQVTGSLNADNASLQEVERNHILAVLEMTGWRIRGKNGAAEILDLKPTTLEARMRKLDIQRK